MLWHLTLAHQGHTLFCCIMCHNDKHSQQIAVVFDKTLMCILLSNFVLLAELYNSVNQIWSKFNVIFKIIFKMFSGKIEIVVVSADLSDFTTGTFPKFKSENLNCYASLFIDEVEVGRTEIIDSNEK